MNRRGGHWRRTEGSEGKQTERREGKEEESTEPRVSQREKGGGGKSKGHAYLTENYLPEVTSSPITSE